MPGIAVSFVAGAIDNGTFYEVATIGVLVSDLAGYVSLDLEPVLKGRQNPLPSLKVVCVADECISEDLTAAVGFADVSLHFILRVPRRYCLQGRERRLLASVQSPDPLDWEISPGSFSALVDATEGEGDCQITSPANRVEREFKFFQVALDPPGGSFDRGGWSQVPPGLIDPSASLEELGRREFLTGSVIEYRQCWFRLGHSLGDIQYSLALAPCELIDLAVIEWSRTDQARRADTAVETESLTHEIRRDREITEAVTANLTEFQAGANIQGGLSGAGSASIPIEMVSLGFGGSHALGTGLSFSSGKRDLTVNGRQDIHDRVVQGAAAVRSRSGTVVVQASQAERNVLQTRTVTNHNHCHALSVQYFEVLRNYKVVTQELRREPRQRVILVPFRVLRFTWELLIRFRTALERVLLRSDLAQCSMRSRDLTCVLISTQLGQNLRTVPLLGGKPP